MQPHIQRCGQAVEHLLYKCKVLCSNPNSPTKIYVCVCVCVDMHICKYTYIRFNYSVECE
jgi:hypothetical protein